MTKAEFIKELRLSLGRLKKAELKRTLEYYSELIDDRIDAGEREAEAIAALGSIESIAEQILSDAKEEGNLRRASRPINTALLILGSPIWVSLLIVAFALIFAVFVSVWAVVIAFIAADFAMAVSGLACIVGGALSGDLNSALFIIGSGCVSAAIGLALFYPVKLLTELCVRLVKWGGIAVGRFFKRLFKDPEVN